MASPVPVTADTPIIIKLLVGSENRRFKIPLKDLTAAALPQKLQTLMNVPEDKDVIFERYSDSAGKYVVLDSANTAVYKQLGRAARAKLKLRLKATIVEKGGKLPETTENNTTTKTRPASSPSSPSVPLTMTPSIGAKTEATPQMTVTHRPSLSWSKTSPSEALPSLPPAPPVHGLGLALPQNRPHVPKAGAPAFTATPICALPARSERACVSAPLTSFTVHCNACNELLPHSHWHCSICEGGDYDLCDDCISKKVHCYDDNHFLIKRTVVNGQVIQSTTERISPRPSATISFATADDKPRAPFAKAPSSSPEPEQMTRTCNCCVESFEESNFVTCQNCEDYDLCYKCHVDLKHGHHPAHTFVPVSDTRALSIIERRNLAPGRGIRHWATCDGCDKDIHGVRYKCTNCPDFDFCAPCFRSPHDHHGHRFAPIYASLSFPPTNLVVHSGIRCDGALCRERTTYIRGDRFKCTVCHDTDFCANCEALPGNIHNRTHPLIKLRVPMRKVQVTTWDETAKGAPYVLGDRSPNPRSSQTAKPTPAAPSANAATQVHTVAEVKPAAAITSWLASTPDACPKKSEATPNKVTTPEKRTPSPPRDAASNKRAASPSKNIEGSPRLLSMTQSVGPSPAAPAPAPVTAPVSVSAPTSPPAQLDAHYVSDTVADGSKLPPQVPVKQTWTLRNPGPLVWPAGCSVHFIGGDRMLNLDDTRALGSHDVDMATQSNVHGKSVGTGEQVTFSVTVKTPQRSGKHISYWRLKTPDGVPFGHKLWVDVNVLDGPVELSSGKVSGAQKAEGERSLTANPPKTPKSSDDKTATVTQSQMVFPTLERESAVSSTHTATGVSAIAASPPSATRPDHSDLESLDLGADDGQTDAGFLTDEEYEILDFESDAQTLASS